MRSKLLVITGLVLIAAVWFEVWPTHRHGFIEHWKHGIIPERWTAMNKQWGADNNGVIPENVYVKDHLLVLRGLGDNYEGPLKGVLKVEGGNEEYETAENGKRTGGVLRSNEFFGSGRYEVTLKMGDEENPNPKGMCVALWLFAYSEHESGEDPKSANPADLLYQVKYRDEDGISISNQEIDFPELGKDNDLNRALFSAYLTPTKKGYTTKEVMLEVNDGEFHTYAVEWRTTLFPLYDVTDRDVTEQEGKLFITNPKNTYQGRPVHKNGTDDYSLYTGKSVVFFVDDKEVARINKFIPFIPMQLHLGVWFPEWAGPAPWEEGRVYVSKVRAIPYRDPGDFTQ